MSADPNLTPQHAGQHNPPAHDHHEHDCRSYLNSLSDYVDGSLGEDLCHELEAHMADCENCRVVVNTLSRTVTLYHQLPEPEMPNAVRERLFKVLNLNDLQAPTDHGSPDD